MLSISKVELIPSLICGTLSGAIGAAIGHTAGRSLVFGSVLFISPIAMIALDAVFRAFGMNQHKSINYSATVIFALEISQLFHNELAATIASLVYLIFNGLTCYWIMKVRHKNISGIYFNGAQII